MSTSKNLECSYCANIFNSKSRNSKQKYCSKPCARKGSPNKNVFKKGDGSWNKGLNISGMSGKKMTQEHKHKIGEANSGEKSYLWKGGITSENYRARRSAKYNDWRKFVFERDNYTCQDCGSKSIKGNRVMLNAHHIKPFSEYTELRTEVDNGQTLCEECHRKVHSFNTGKKATLESNGQTYEELING